MTKKILTFVSKHHIIDVNIQKRGENMKELNVKTNVSEKELRRLVGIYKQMTPVNRFFLVSASGLLLASQSADGQMEEDMKEEV